LEFETISALAVFDRAAGEPEFVSVDNIPAEYLEIASDPNRNKRDPVMQHCKHKSVPIIWDQATYLAANQGAKWEQQAQHGYACGIAWAMHMPGGRHFMVGLDRPKPLPTSSAELTRMVASLQLFTVHAQEAMSGIVAPSPATVAPSLTPRELETLRWTMAGKTAWEVGRILGIAEDTVARHAHSATRKLECSSKHHAVVKALRLGLIQ
jgi:DNA-binding CsgD family transcriptional regulator